MKTYLRCNNVDRKHGCHYRHLLQYLHEVFHGYETMKINVSNFEKY